MCGRAVQSRVALLAAASLLNSVDESHTTTPTTTTSCHQEVTFTESQVDGNNNTHGDDKKMVSSLHEDNWNMSPGMTSVIFRKPTTIDDETSFFVPTCSTWGLVTRPGTKRSPLPPGPSKHFSNLMFNARSDTLYDKKVFRELALKGNTCVWAIDGFFEWNESEKNVLSSSKNTMKKKQPYFIHRKDGLPLLVAGLWTEVSDGNENNIHTFTALTTNSCSDITWLHHRQPVFLWDVEMAKKWIEEPSEMLCHHFSSSNSSSTDGKLAWHPVTKDMNKLSYTDAKSIQPVKVEKIPSVKSFFTSTTTTVKDGCQMKSHSDPIGESLSSTQEEKSFDAKDISSAPTIDLTNDNNNNNFESNDASSTQKHTSMIKYCITDGSNKRQKIVASSKKKNTMAKGKITNFFPSKKDIR